MNACERKRPVAGIGFGQRGYWGNEHYSSMDSARKAFDDYCDETRSIYGRERMGFVEEEGEPRPETGLLAVRRFVNRKKNGARGKIVHTVHLYAIDEQRAARYMEDPFYCPRP